VIYEPSPYQVLGINHLVENERAALFAGLGLGKTSMTLAAYCQLLLSGQTTGALIVAPVRVCNLTWPDEIAKWETFRWLKVANLRTEEGWKKLEQRDGHIFLINYELLPKLMEKYLHGRRGAFAFDTVIFDELTKAKNPDSKRIKMLSTYLHKVPRRWGLTGTPNPNSLLELFAQVRLLDDGQRLGKSYAQFRDTYFTAHDYHGYDLRLNPGADEKIYGRISDLALVLRSSDYLDIPDTILEDIEVPIPAKARQRYDELQEELLTHLSEHGVDVVAPNAAVLAGKLLQMTGGAVYVEDIQDETITRKTIEIHDAKLQALERLLKRLDEPCLVICNYRHERERILKRIAGSVTFTGSRDEVALLARWNSGAIKCLVADPRSIGHGLNMQAGGRVVIWFSLNWSRELYDQTNARLARRGQSKVPLIYRLLSPGTMDDAVAETLRTRLEGQSALLQSLVNLQKLLGRQ
jgi:SNF2 family DNA or RNA helicase